VGQKHRRSLSTGLEGADMKPRHGLWCIGLLLAFVGVVWLTDAEPQFERPKDRDGLKHDPIESDPAFAPIIAEADREAQRQLDEMRAKKGRPGVSWLGDVHFFYAVKKQFLKDKYGIDWQSPAETNPHVAID
jgi:hypothetical protein